MANENDGIGFGQRNEEFEYQRIGNEDDDFEDLQPPLKEIYSGSYRAFRRQFL